MPMLTDWDYTRRELTKDDVSTAVELLHKAAGYSGPNPAPLPDSDSQEPLRYLFAAHPVGRSLIPYECDVIARRMWELGEAVQAMATKSMYERIASLRHQLLVHAGSGTSYEFP